MVYGFFIMDLASLVVGDMEHYTPYTTKRSETHKKTTHYQLPQEVFYWITWSRHPKRSARCRSWADCWTHQPWTTFHQKICRLLWLSNRGQWALAQPPARCHACCHCPPGKQNSHNNKTQNLWWRSHTRVTEPPTDQNPKSSSRAHKTAEKKERKNSQVT